MAQTGLGKFNGKTSPSSDKNTESQEKIVDTEGKVIGEPEIEAVMDGKNVNREQAISHIRSLRKQAYKKQALNNTANSSNPTPNRMPAQNNIKESEKMEETDIESMGLATVEDSALVAVKQIVLEPVVSIAKAVNLRQYLSSAIEKVLIKGKHYGNPINPKTGKPAWGTDKLLKPGAEVLANMFGLEARFTELQTLEDFDKNVYRYKMKCELVALRSGLVVGSAVAAASSQEAMIQGGGAELWNNTLQRAQKRAYVKAVEHTLGVDEFFINAKKYSI